VRGGRFGKMMRAALLGLLLLGMWPYPGKARVLEDKDFEKISEVKTLFLNLTGDIAQSLQVAGISAGEVNCMKRTLQDLALTSDELGSYEYLITIESQMDDFGDDRALKDILRYAVARALDVLETERKHLDQLSDQCSRFPLSVAKTRQAVQFIDATTAILNSIRPRL
jgi:hypothetical protein